MNKLPWLRVFLRRFAARLRYAFRFRDMWTWKLESCRRCGCTYRVVSHWKDLTWLNVTGREGGCLCLNCFVELANEREITLCYNDLVKLWGETVDGYVYFIVGEK